MSLKISMFHSVPGVPRAKMERLVGVQPTIPSLSGVPPLLFAAAITSKLIPVNHLHKPLPEFFANGYAFIGDINMVIFYFTKLLIIYNIRIMHPYKRQLQLLFNIL